MSKPTPPNGMVSNTELILRKILGEDVTPLPPNSRVEFYLTQVEEYIEKLATGATRPIGETTTPLTDGATTNPIVIDGNDYTAQINDLVFYGNKEFLFTANGWREVGDITNLNADMIDDTNTTNKFATAAQLSQIKTNKTNISSIQGDINNISAPIIDTFEQGWVDISTGIPTANTNRCSTIKTFVKGGETLRIIANGMYYNVATWTGSTYNGIISGGWIQDNGRDLMFSDDRYVVVGVRKADNANITPTDVVSIVVHNVNTIKRNTLYGGTIIFDGDSICSAGSEGNAPYNGYAYRIGHGNTMTYHNVGVGGATIAGDTYYQDSSPRHWISRYIDTIHQNYSSLDYLILEGGTNDADILGNNGIGTLDVNDYSGSYDDTTFTGALDSLFYKALNYYPNAKIGFIIAQKMGVSNDYTSTGNIRRKFFERAMDVCKKWGISYINLWDNSTLNPKLPCYYNSSLDEQGNRDGGYAYTDGQHLTGIGYDIISPAIESWIRTL